MLSKVERLIANHSNSSVPSHSHASVRKLLDDMTIHMAALKSLEINVYSWDPIIVAVITRKFDFNHKKMGI